MKLRIRMLSGILAGGMLLPCIAVKAEDECSAKVESIVHRIDKQITVMSYSTVNAWSIYADLVKGYGEYFLDKRRSKQFYDALLKLEQSVQRMPITDPMLTRAIYALYSCYAALYEERNTKYDIAYNKWEETLKMYSLLSLEMKDTRYAPIFDFMIEHCTSRMKVCVKKGFAVREYYDEFFKDMINELKGIYGKPPEERSETRIDSLENIIVYEFLEPLRSYRNQKKRLPIDEFLESVRYCSRQLERNVKFFKGMAGNFPRIEKKLELLARKIIDAGDDFRKDSDYSSAIEHYCVARVFLHLSGNNAALSSYLTVNISNCKKCMKGLGEDARF